LGFITHIPKIVLGVVTGLLPVVLLVVLMTLVPIVCRCKFSSSPEITILTCFRDGKIKWRSHPPGRRAQNPTLVHGLPSSPSVPRRHVLLGSFIGRESNRCGSNYSNDASSQEFTQSLQFLHFVLHSARSQYCSRRPPQYRRFGRFRHPGQIPRQVTPQDV